VSAGRKNMPEPAISRGPPLLHPRGAARQLTPSEAKRLRSEALRSERRHFVAAAKSLRGNGERCAAYILRCSARVRYSVHPPGPQRGLATPVRPAMGVEQPVEQIVDRPQMDSCNP